MYGFAYKPKNDCSYASIENSRRRRRENFDDLEVVPGDCPGLENSFCRVDGDVVVNVGKNPPNMENVVPCRREKLCVKEIKNKKGVPRQCCFTGVDTGWTDKTLPDCSTMSERADQLFEGCVDDLRNLSPDERKAIREKRETSDDLPHFGVEKESKILTPGLRQECCQKLKVYCNNYRKCPKKRSVKENFEVSREVSRGLLISVLSLLALLLFTLVPPFFRGVMRGYKCPRR
jgi:hypothetical protein